MYHYRCQVVRVIDGDTVELLIDMGLHTSVRRIARLLGINAPEIHGESLPAGERCKRRLTELIDQADDELCCKTYLDRNDKYGRLLVELYPHVGEVKSFNAILVAEDLAVAYAV